MKTPSSPVLATEKENLPTHYWADIDDAGQGDSINLYAGDEVESAVIGSILGADEFPCADLEDGSWERLDGEQRDIAAFICRAANSHAALVAAVTDAVNYFGLCDCGLDSCSNCGKQSVPSKLRAALALATGGAK